MKITKTAQEISSKELYQQFMLEGKAPNLAAEEVLDIVTDGMFVTVEEPKRTEIINKVIAKYSRG